MIRKTTTDKFEEDVLKSIKPCIVKFYTDTCIPCKLIHPLYLKLSEDHPEYDFFEVNAETEYKLTEKYCVLSVPTFIFIRNGKEVLGVVGKIIEKDLEVLNG